MDGITPLFAFALTALIIEITPGPNMTYLAALSLSSGIRTGFAAVAGIALGLATYGIVAALGLAAVIEHSPLLYGILRWGGVAYLLWLAWEAWSSEREASPDATDGPDGEPLVAFRRGLITNLLNPKAAVFYVAVLPEFIRPGAGSVMSQTLALGAIYVTIATTIHAGIVALAGSFKSMVSASNSRRLVRRLALALVGIAIWFALTTGHA
jgi:threonine/homoserine/homoserine lactone efflux protein